MNRLLTGIPQLEKYFRMIMQKAAAGAQLRSKLLYEMSKEEFDMMKSKFSFLTRVLEITVEKAKQML